MKHVGLVLILPYSMIYSTVCREEDAAEALRLFAEGGLPPFLGDHNLSLRHDQPRFRVATASLLGLEVREEVPPVRQPSLGAPGGQLTPAPYFGRS